MSIRFKLDSININMGLFNNQEAWDHFERNFLEHYDGVPARMLHLDIFAGASPEGSAAHNRWLGENRGQAVRRLVRQRLGNRIGAIIVHNEGARWEGLYDAIAASNEPWREEALSIIDQPAGTDENSRDPREVKLRNLWDGEAWPVLRDKYLSPLRSGATAILTYYKDTLVVKDTVFVAGGAPPTVINNYYYEEAPREKPKKEKPPRKVFREPAWIIRTNLPLLGTGTPNLQFEWSLDHKDRWSLNVEAMGPWWIFAHNAYANQIAYGSAEIRLWLGNRSRHSTLDGWHIGLAGGAGLYDLEWKSRGYQGEAAMAFVNIGWQHRFGKRQQWAFDIGIGLGYMYGPYRRYLGSSIFPEGKTEQYDDHLMWQETNRVNWVGAPHANISLGYVFRYKNGAKRRAALEERDLDYEAARFLRDSLRRTEGRKAARKAEKEMRKVADDRLDANMKAIRKQGELADEEARALADSLRQGQRVAKRARLKEEREAQKKAVRAEMEARIARRAQKEARWAAEEREEQLAAQKALDEKVARSQARREAKAAEKTAKAAKKAAEKAAAKAAKQAREERLAAEKAAAKAAKEAAAEEAKAAKEAAKRAKAWKKKNKQK